MTLLEVLLPLFVQVALTFALLFWMAFSRTRSLKAGTTNIPEIALREPNWPPEVTQIANAFHNQLEVPLLFYVLTILALETGHAGYGFVVLAWIFVALRILHAAIHVTTNNVRLRGPAYILGVIVLVLMWADYMVDIIVWS
ncbi:MAG TPA: MAPEG family protein [Xanthobacteraceae bacterium]|nr:MAPEG family protein [Xanthobacteraceae bacterium]